MNRLRVEDAPLDRHAADCAAVMRRAIDVSVADAHLATVPQAFEGPFAVLTSDVDDVRRIVDHTGVAVAVVRL